MHLLSFELTSVIINRMSYYSILHLLRLRDCLNLVVMAWCFFESTYVFLFSHFQLIWVKQISRLCSLWVQRIQRGAKRCNVINVIIICEPQTLIIKPKSELNNLPIAKLIYLLLNVLCSASIIYHVYLFWNKQFLVHLRLICITRINHVLKKQLPY